MSKISEKRRLSIMNAAYEECTIKGLDGASMADIAQRAGIGKSTIYEYFSSKTELLSQACVLCMNDMERQSLEQLQGQGSVQVRTQNYCQVIWRYIGMLSALGTGAVMTDSVLVKVVHTQASGFNNRAIAAFEALLQEGQATGEIRPDVDLNATAVLLANLPSPRMAYAAQQAQLNDDISRLVAVVFQGLRP